MPLDEKSHGMERNHTWQKVQRIFWPDFNFARCNRSQYFIADLFPTVLPALDRSFFTCLVPWPNMRSPRLCGVVNWIRAANTARFLKVSNVMSVWPYA